MQLYLVSLYYDSHRVTGANKRFDNIGQRMLRTFGDDVSVIVTRGNAPCWCPESNLLYIKPYASRFGRILTWLHLNFVLFRCKPGVLISDFMPLPLWLVRRKHVLLQLIHDLRNFGQYKRGGLGLLSALFQRWQINKPDYILTVSNFSKTELIDKCHIDPASIFVSYNGIEPYLGPFKKERTVDLLYVATFEPRKNHRTLISALAEIDKPLNVVFVGRDLGCMQEIKDFDSILLGNSPVNIMYVDSIEEEGLQGLYQDSKAFISPAIYEGFGMPLIEAYNYGCKVLCSDIEVFREVTMGTATYFDPHDAESICAAIQCSIEANNCLSSDDQDASLRVRHEFNWDNIVARLVDTLAQIQHR